MAIIVYLTPTCIWCKKLEEFLKKKKIPFERRDVTEESVYRDELLEKSAQLAVPVIDIDGKIIIGFEEKQIEEALAKK